MTTTFFIFLLIFLLIFHLFNKKYEKKHNNKSFLQETKTDKALKNLVIADDIFRVSNDISKISILL